MALIRLMEEVIPSTWLIFSMSSPLRFPAPRGVPGLVLRLICDISKSIAQHNIPSLLTLLNEATATQFQDHIGGLCHFLTVGDDDDTFLAFLGQLLQNGNDVTGCLFV